MKLIKVCGMRQADNIRQIENLGIDMMGFIFYPHSSRMVNKKPEYMPTTAKRVGVFVNADIKQIRTAIDEYKLDYIQLHGTESPDLCKEIGRLTKKKIIKAFPIATADDFKATKQYEDCCEYFLFDTKCLGFGGSGNTFDWHLLDAYCGPKPFLLSGGICNELIPQLATLHHKYLAGFDLNSKFETAPAVKDVDKIDYFIKRMKTV